MSADWMWVLGSKICIVCADGNHVMKLSLCDVMNSVSTYMGGLYCNCNDYVRLGVSIHVHVNKQNILLLKQFHNKLYWHQPINQGGLVGSRRSKAVNLLLNKIMRRRNYYFIWRISTIDQLLLWQSKNMLFTSSQKLFMNIVLTFIFSYNKLYYVRIIFM